MFNRNQNHFHNKLPKKNIYIIITKTYAVLFQDENYKAIKATLNI